MEVGRPLRRSHRFRAAILPSMPLIALTHVPIIVGNRWLVGAGAQEVSSQSDSL